MPIIMETGDVDEYAFHGTPAEAFHLHRRTNAKPWRGHRRGTVIVSGVWGNGRKIILTLKKNVKPKWFTVNSETGEMKAFTVYEPTRFSRIGKRKRGESHNSRT